MRQAIEPPRQVWRRHVVGGEGAIGRGGRLADVDPAGRNGKVDGGLHRISAGGNAEAVQPRNTARLSLDRDYLRPPFQDDDRHTLRRTAAVVVGKCDLNKVRCVRYREEMRHIENFRAVRQGESLQRRTIRPINLEEESIKRAWIR